MPDLSWRRSEALRYTVLQRHQCTLLKCEDFGFLGAEEASWLDEAYSDTIVDVDTGVLARARSLGQHISFFEFRTLERMAERLDLQLTSRYNIHVFHRSQVGRFWGTVALTRLNRLAAPC